MSSYLEKQAVEEAVRRFHICGNRCECVYMEHGHSYPCNKEIKVRFYKHRRPDVRTVMNSSDIMIICSSCHQQIQSGKGKIY